MVFKITACGQCMKTPRQVQSSLPLQLQEWSVVMSCAPVWSSHDFHTVLLSVTGCFIVCSQKFEKFIYKFNRSRYNFIRERISFIFLNLEGCFKSNPLLV